MKKANIRSAQSRSGHAPGLLRLRRAGVVVLSVLIGGLGLLASRPAHTVGGPIPVTVANTPLATTPTDVAAPQQPFTARTVYLIQSGTEFGDLDTGEGYKEIAVPAGKRLVIQTVSVSRSGFGGGTIQAYIRLVTNGKNSFYALPAVPNSATLHAGASQALTLYADPGSIILFAVDRSQPSGTEFVEFSVSGYLVNA